MKLILLCALFSLLSITSVCSETLKGMHDTIGGPQSNGFENMTKLSGVAPSAFSSDFGFSTHPNDDYRKRKELLEKIVKLPPSVKVITLSWHQCRPDIQEPCTFNTGVSGVDYSDKEWDELLKWDSPLNKAWQKQTKKLAEFLLQLKEKNITIYLRPYHESNLPLFWWSNIKKPAHSIALWKMLHKYLVEDHKLTNLKWVWSFSYHPKHLTDLQKFYPGDTHVDVIGVDIYPPKKESAPLFQEAWDLMNKISSRPKALTEVSRLPDAKVLEKRPWLYVIPWGEVMLRNENKIENIKTFFQGK